MSENNKSNEIDNEEDFRKLLEKDNIRIPQVGDIVKGVVISASKSEVKLDIDGVLIGIVRGPELYSEAEEYANLKPGDEVEATVIEEENENGELELSFKHAGQERAWLSLRDAYENKKIVKVKIIEANKGGLLVRYCQIQGFLPVSQLAPENYPRVSGGDKSKILEKLKSFIGEEFEVKIVTLDEKEDKIIFSEKDVWSEKQKDTIAKYKVGSAVEGKITAVTDFGVFINFGTNMEGLIHISELAWQRIDNPADLFKVGDKIKAEVISVDGSKIFLSAKKLINDPWREAGKKYKVGQIVKCIILKVNPFGLFVELDNNIHGLAHISQLNLAPDEKVNEKFKVGQSANFEIMSIEPKDHRLGLKLAKEKRQETVAVKTEQANNQELTSSADRQGKGKNKEKDKTGSEDNKIKGVEAKAAKDVKKTKEKKDENKIKVKGKTKGKKSDINKKKDQASEQKAVKNKE